MKSSAGSEIRSMGFDKEYCQQQIQTQDFVTLLVTMIGVIQISVK